MRRDPKAAGMNPGEAIDYPLLRARQRDLRGEILGHQISNDAVDDSQ